MTTYDIVYGCLAAGLVLGMFYNVMHGIVKQLKRVADALEKIAK